MPGESCAEQATPGFSGEKVIPALVNPTSSQSSRAQVSTVIVSPVVLVRSASPWIGVPATTRVRLRTIRTSTGADGLVPTVVDVPTGAMFRFEGEGAARATAVAPPTTTALTLRAVRSRKCAPRARWAG